jgi:hypothetical protein
MAKFNDIQLLRTTFLRGPNIWTYRPVLEVWLDLGELEDYPSNKIPGLNDRLTSWLPDLIEHPAASASAAASSSAWKAAPGWAMCWSTSSSSC